MKKEVEPEFLWHLNSVVLTFQVAIVTTVDSEGRINAAPFGLIFPFSISPKNPQLLLCSNSVWHTSQNIESTGEFVVNYTSYSLMAKVADAGRMFPAGVNELEKTGLTPLPAVKVKPPRIKECFQHIECRLNQVIRPSDNQSNFIGDVISITINEELLGKGREEILRIVDPLLLFGMDVTSNCGNYAGVGKTTSYASTRTDLE